MSFPIPDDLAQVLRDSPALGNAYLVGGCVRDWLLRRPVRDFDIEVFGVNYDRLSDALSHWGRTDLVGRSFGVIKLNTGAGIYDFSIPRRDSKVGTGHKGFQVEFDEGITPREASARRDFTINALMFDPRLETVSDFHGGQADLENGILRHTSSAFVEDPLRVLRGMQLVSRFNLTAAAETIALCRSIKTCFHELARERVREEWFKWAGESVRPSQGLLFLRDTEWIEHFPEIQSLAGTPQDPEWHPEGDVFTHTCHGCDAMSGLATWREADTESRLVYMLATLAHDFGKPTTTSETILAGRRRIVSPGHEEAGCPLARSFLQRMMSPKRIEDRVVPLVGNHLFHIHGAITDRSVRRLARRLYPETIEGLCIVMTADHFGRPPKPKVVPDSIRQLREMAQAMSLQSAGPKPVLMGRHLIELGMKPGPEFKVVLNAAFESQLDGHFEDLSGAFNWLYGQDQLPLTIQARQELAKRISRAAIETSEASE